MRWKLCSIQRLELTEFTKFQPTGLTLIFSCKVGVTVSYFHGNSCGVGTFSARGQEYPVSQEEEPAVLRPECQVRLIAKQEEGPCINQFPSGRLASFWTGKGHSLFCHWASGVLGCNLGARINAPLVEGSVRLSRGTILLRGATTTSRSPSCGAALGDKTCVRPVSSVGGAGEFMPLGVGHSQLRSSCVSILQSSQASCRLESTECKLAQVLASGFFELTAVGLCCHCLTLNGG